MQGCVLTEWLRPKPAPSIPIDLLADCEKYVLQGFAEYDLIEHIYLQNGSIEECNERLGAARRCLTGECGVDIDRNE